jgi:hypothetical protein
MATTLKYRHPARPHHLLENGNGHEVLRLTREEIVKRLEDGARERCRVSARTFLRLHRQNRLKDPGAVADLLALSYLLKRNDPLFREG